MRKTDDKLLRWKTNNGIAGFLIALWVLLFLPAWSLDFGETWIYWILFSISVIPISLYFLQPDPPSIESRLRAGPAAKPECQKIIPAFMSVTFIVLFIIPGIVHRLRWSNIP